MNENDLVERLAESFDAAGGCPPPETFLAENLADLAPQARLALNRHAAECPACAAERRLAAAFDAPEAGAYEVAEVVARLNESSAPTPAPRSRRWLPAIGFAVAATVVLGVTALLLPLDGLGPPAVPAGGGTETVRSASLEALSPVGYLDAAPTEMRWRALATAAAYRLRIIRVDGATLWEERVSLAQIDLPPEVRAQLNPGVRYLWEVEALDKNNARIAWSPRIDFKIRLQARQ